jgi:hypothetical protein
LFPSQFPTQAALHQPNLNDSHQPGPSIRNVAVQLYRCSSIDSKPNP